MSKARKKQISVLIPDLPAAVESVVMAVVVIALLEAAHT